MLTLWPPDARYKILRRYAERFPPGSLWWFSLQACAAPLDAPFRHRSFVPHRLHWRLRGTALGHYFVHEWQSRRAAAAMRRALRAAPFRPDVVWLLPELGAASVGLRLHKLLGVPLHATSHDAHETARDLIPRAYYPSYASRVASVFRAAASVDAISAGMLEHLRATSPAVAAGRAVVLHPSIHASLVVTPAPARNGEWARSRVRRIGLCGSMRVSEAQWRQFLEKLGALPYDIEIVSLAYQDSFFRTALPGNVRLVLLPFADTEADVIRLLHEYRCDACYLGLWTDPAHALFGRTSLSAKLASYAASSLPIIVDAREDSAAWRLVARWGGGVRLDESEQGPDAALRRLFEDPGAWSAMAAGAGRLAREEFDIERNFPAFMDRIRAAGSPSRGAHD